MTDLHDKPTQGVEENSAPSSRDMSGADLGLNFMVSVLVGTAMGYAIDQWLNTLPLFMLIFMVLGFVAGLRVIWQKMNADRRE